MTWEWAFFLSVISACVTLAFIFSRASEKTTTNDEATRTRLMHLEQFFCDSKSEFDKVYQLANDTKKLLSEANLAKGFKR